MWCTLVAYVVCVFCVGSVVLCHFVCVVECMLYCVCYGVFRFGHAAI